MLVQVEFLHHRLLRQLHAVSIAAHLWAANESFGSYVIPSHQLPVLDSISCLSSSIWEQQQVCLPCKA